MILHDLLNGFEAFVRYKFEYTVAAKIALPHVFVAIVVCNHWLGLILFHLIGSKGECLFGIQVAPQELFRLKALEVLA